MAITPQEPPPLLTYQVRTNPDPLQASPQTGDASTATLLIIVSNSTRNPIDCSSITFGFLKGSNANELFAESTGIGTTAPKGWKLAQDDATFTATPDTPNDAKIGPDGLTFGLSNIQVNQQVGTTKLKITELSGSHTGVLLLPLAKFPPEFSLGPLQANPINVATGGSTTLTWSGSGGASYELQYEDADGNTVNVTHVKDDPNSPLPPAGSYTVHNLQTGPTVFTLLVTLQNDDGDNSQKVQRQVVVAVSQLTLDFETAPTTVAPNGVTKLSWHTTQATSCILDPGNQSVPVNGHQYVIITPDKANQAFTLTAYGNAGVSKQAQVTVSVDSTIVPTDTLSTAGANGTDGSDGASQRSVADPVGDGTSGGDGLPGNNITDNCSLDPSSKPSKVWLINASGGAGGRGGSGGRGGLDALGWWGRGGNAGNAGNGADAGTITLIFDPAADTRAGYIVISRGGKGGSAGTGGDGTPPGANGNRGQDGKDGQIILIDAPVTASAPPPPQTDPAFTLPQTDPASTPPQTGPASTPPQTGPASPATQPGTTFHIPELDYKPPFE